MHDETLILPIHELKQLHASQYKHKTWQPSHPLHKHTTTLQGLNNYLQQPPLHNKLPTDTHTVTTTDTHTVTTTDIKTNLHHIHTSIVSRYLATRGNTKILRTPPTHIISSEEILPRITHGTLDQLRTNKSPFLKSYLHKVDAKSH